MIDLLSLNENQRSAVLWDKGPLLVLAGPGSGKTRVITYRIAKVLQETAGQYFRILALTFTNKAAAEMRSRIETLIPDELSRLRITTFHSYAAELLQQHGNHIGIRPDFQILSNDSDRQALLDDVLYQVRKDQAVLIPEHFKSSQLLPVITRFLEHCIPIITAEQIINQANFDNAIPLAHVYISYRKALRTSNYLDFPSLIAETLDLLTHYPALSKHIRKVYKHILIDEFQDTNLSQYQLLSLIVQPDPQTLFVVADDDQIIYQWNGASPKRIQSLLDDFQVSQIQLPENYRCPPYIIQLANALIEKNLNRSTGKKPLTAFKKENVSNVFRCIRFRDYEEEIDWIAKDILNRETADRANCAVLARTKKFLELAGRKIEDAGIPVYFSSRKDEFNSAPLRMLHSILRLVNSSTDKQSLSRLSKAFYEIEGINIELDKVLSRASVDNLDILRSWIEETIHRDSLSNQTKQLLTTDISPLLNTLNYCAFADCFFKWSEQFQETPPAFDNAFDEYEDEKKVWNLLISDIVKKFEGEDLGLHQLLHELDLTSKTLPRPPESIPCLTIHASKGMEFGHVYLIGMVEEHLPSWAALQKGDNSLEMQEERRNCFVAITRAQESLTLTYADKAFGWSKAPSRFLKEMGIQL